jgi:hypothetical protein
MLSERDMCDQYVRHILNGAMVSSLKAFAVCVRADQRPRLVEQRFTVRGRRLVGSEQLVDLHDQSRERVQPRKPRVVQHEAQERAAAFDAPLLPLVADAGIVEECLVDAQQAAADVVELLSGIL